MDNQIQLLSFLFSFLFGIFFSFTGRYHYKMVFSLKKMFRYFLTFLYILDISLMYIVIMYYINQGVIHLYFVIITFFGYALEKKIYSYVKKYVKSCHSIANPFRK